MASATGRAETRRRRALSLRARLTLGFLTLVVAIGGVTLVLLDRTLGRALTAEADVRQHRQANAVAQWLEQAGRPEKLAPRLARVIAADITIVGKDGVILGDSADPSAVGKPLGAAPEVAAARRGRVGRAERVLERGGVTMYLVAVRTPDGGAVRVAVPLSTLEVARRQLRNRILLAGAIGFGAALLFGAMAIRALTRPLQAMTRTAEQLARGDYRVTPGPGHDADDELGLLSRTLSQLAGELEARIGDLTTQRDLSNAVVEALVEGVVAVDHAGEILLANRAAKVLLGGTTLPPEVTALEPTTDEADLVINGRDVRVTVRPLRADGKVIVLSDVTQLRALDRVRRDFLASAAHELRTPVTSISGYAETLLGDVPEAMRKEFLATIHRNAARIARLVNDLLVLERLDARPERLAERVAVPLGPVVAHAVATTRGAAPAPVAIDVDVPDDAIALGDLDGLEHVVQNLVDNAVRHGGGKVTVRARRDGRRVRLDVTDDGPGVPAEHHARIFERFYRVDPGGGHSRGGSGLGLAIVDQQVAAMGGTVRVKSPPGAGATFTVELDAG